MRNWIYTALLYIAPQHLLTLLMYKLTRARFAPWKNWQMRWFIKRYNVDMSLAIEENTLKYPDFNTFFTRALKPEARPIAANEAALVCPADGTVSQAGNIEHDRLFQAKGHYYTLSDLLAGDEKLAATYIDGDFATIYLSPRDYHRVHMPCEAVLQSMTYVPGKLFSVNDYTARNVPRLFARNERIICTFMTQHGPMILILVGAFNVGSMETIWHGMVTPPYGRKICHWRYDDQHIGLQKGEEMGRFNMGSTVIMLLPKGYAELVPAVHSSAHVVMGQELFYIKQ
jgi:phosphatidylserine decarboxylase